MVAAGLAPVGHRCVEGGHLFDGVGVFLGRSLEVLVEAVVAFTPVNNVFNVVKKQGRYGFAMLVGMASYYGALRWIIRDEIRLEAFPQAMIVGRGAFVVTCFILIAHLRWIEVRDS